MNSNWRNRPTTIDFIDRNRIDAIINIDEKYSLQGTTQGNGLTGGAPPVRFSM